MVEKFTEYFNTFKKEDAIIYKYKHSIRVMELCVMIGKSLNLNDDELEIIKLIGLLHDYSRFSQWDKYHNFDDLETFDHADEAVRILFEENEIKKYNLNKNYYPIVYDAIKYHNKYEIGFVDEASLLYCKIIRDADKLDILEQFIKAVFMDSKENFIHNEVKEDFFNHMSVKRIKNGTINDLLVIKIALIYDLNFEFSFHYIKENKIIEKIEKQIDKNTFDIYLKEIKKYMEEKTC